MEIKIPYGTGVKVLRTPPEVEHIHLGPARTTPLNDIPQALADSCRRPVAGQPLADRVTSDSSIVIATSDLTRNPVTQEILPACVKLLKELGASPSSIRILVARGAHRKLTKFERDVFKVDGLAGIGFEEHDCDEPAKLSALLLTRRGTPVRVNRLLKEASVVILLSPVSFHYFAGFGGGRKLVLPGSSDRAAILVNHRLSLVNDNPVVLDPKCRPGVLEGNPVNEDMCEAVEALEGVFAINYFADVAGNAVFINAGDPILSHASACEAYSETHRLELDQTIDLMILSAGGAPYDINLLQSHKALRHAVGAMKNGGTILFYAECEEGVGSTSLENALSRDKQEFLGNAYQQYDLNNQTAISLHNLTETCEIGMVSAMNVDVLLSCGIKPCVNAEAFLAEALERHGSNRVTIVENGSSVLFHTGKGTLQ